MPPLIAHALCPDEAATAIACKINTANQLTPLCSYYPLSYSVRNHLRLAANLEWSMTISEISCFFFPLSEGDTGKIKSSHYV